MSGFVFGERGWMVECELASGIPYSGGRVIGFTAVQFHMNGGTDVILDQHVPGVLPCFGPDGWFDAWNAAGEHRWRAVKEDAVDVLGDGLYFVHREKI